MNFIKKPILFCLSLPVSFVKNLYKEVNYTKSLWVFALICFLSLYYGSLFFFEPLDSSWITTTIPEVAIKNPFGSQGAWLSSFFFYFFGLGAWLVPLPLVFLSLSFLKEQRKLMFFNRLFFSWILMLPSLLFLLNHYQTIVNIKGIDFLAGGSIGLSLSLWFIKNWGLTGTNILAFFSLTYSLILSLNLISILDFFSQAVVYCYENIKSLFIFLFKMFFTKSEEKESTESSLVQEKKKRTRKSLNFFQKIPESSLQAIFKCSNLSKIKTGSEEREISELIIKTLAEFNVEGKILDYVKGPSLTTYNFTPAEGVRQAKIISLINDLGLALKTQALIIKPSANKRALEIQVPNRNPITVFLGNILNSKVYTQSKSPLTLAFGVTEKGDAVCEDLKEMPHILIAGSTGTGKSVCLNSFICSILVKATPESVRFLMIDPKMLELSIYDKIPHLLAPVITTDLNKATAALRWAVHEMERRYKIMQKLEVKSLSDYNQKIKNQKKPNAEEQDEEEIYENLPYVVLVIDELADLMLMAAKDIEQLIQRLSQKARACGIHLILATQRPSVDVVTGVIKSNLPCRLSFRVVSRYDSRTILDQIDAEKLLGKGDMFFMKPGNQNLQRIQGSFVSTEEVSSLVERLNVEEKTYDETVVRWINNKTEEGKSIAKPESSSDHYALAKAIGKRYGTVSTSFLQRQLKIGYNKAADIIEQLEEEGLITKAEGSKKRKWIVDENP